MLESIRSSKISFLSILNTKFVVAVLHAENGEVQGLTEAELSIPQDAGVTTLLLTEPLCIGRGSGIWLRGISDVNIRI